MNQVVEDTKVGYCSAQSVVIQKYIVGGNAMIRVPLLILIFPFFEQEGLD